MLEDLQKANETVHWINKTASFSTHDQDFQDISDTVVALGVPSLLLSIDRFIAGSFEGVSYAAPLRAAAERYYRRQDLAVAEVDSQGTNLAMFLSSLSDTAKKRFQDWTREQLGFTVRSRLEGGHISIKIQEGEEEEYNLADMGFGFSQIIPVITQMWDRLERIPKERSRRLEPLPVVFAIEQPELHLHPALQARLADLFLSVINVAKHENLNVIFLIETHSETIINRVGNRIALSKDSDTNPVLKALASDVNLVIFERESPGLVHVRTASFNEAGYLNSHWPFGFFEPELI